MYLAISIIALLLLGSVAYAAASGAPWVPTWKRDMERLKKLLDLKPGERFVELGCGNGRVCRYLAKESGVSVDGLELSVVQWAIAWLQSLGQKNVRILFGNVFKKDLSEYDAVYLFLMPETYEKLRVKFDAELKAGVRVVSYVWGIKGWVEVRVDKEAGRPDLYLYVKS